LESRFKLFAQLIQRVKHSREFIAIKRISPTLRNVKSWKLTELLDSRMNRSTLITSIRMNRRVPVGQILTGLELKTVCGEMTLRKYVICVNLWTRNHTEGTLQFVI
uniref:Ribosomal protein S4 n=1 Tax=Brugia pahangi TaxID=6280 RepID=A0A158PQ82_BRUPA